MTRRPVVTLAALAVVLAALSVAATLRQVIPQVTFGDVNFDGTDQLAMDEYYAWVNSGWVYYFQGPWLATAAIVAGVTALALAAYRAQRRLEDQAGSASATASREVSRSSARSAASGRSSS